MYLRNLRLYNFRNIEEATVSLAPGVNFVVGQNGQGKTNLAEAIHFLSLARSFRSSNVRELVCWGQREASVFGVVQRELSDVELGVAIQKGKKDVFVNQERVKNIAEFISRLLCVGFTPGDLALVKGGPQGRRRLIDRHMAEMNPAFMQTLLDYHRALRSKNTLLKSGTASRINIMTWNEILVRYMVGIYSARVEFLRKLGILANKYHSEYSLQDGELSLCLRSSVGSGEEEVNEKTTMERLERAVEKELAQRSCVIGTHRDDVIIRLGERDARAYSSQGQARSIVLSLKLAVIELLETHYGESPVIVLDDVDSELDNRRSRAFFDLIFSQGRQVVITGTELRRDLAFFSETTVWGVEEGRIEKESEINQAAANE